MTSFLNNKTSILVNMLSLNIYF